MGDNSHTHRIEIYEPQDFSGPNPLHAVGLGVIYSPDKIPCYLLDLRTPMRFGEEEASQLLVRPRHADPIEQAINSACTVAIARVKPENSLQVDSSYKFTEVVNWGIGKITPIANGSHQTVV